VRHTYLQVHVSDQCNLSYHHNKFRCRYTRSPPLLRSTQEQSYLRVIEEYQRVKTSTLFGLETSPPWGETALLDFRSDCQTVVSVGVMLYLTSIITASLSSHRVTKRLGSHHASLWPLSGSSTTLWKLYDFLETLRLSVDSTTFWRLYDFLETLRLSGDYTRTTFWRLYDFLETLRLSGDYTTFWRLYDFLETLRVRLSGSSTTFWCF